MGYTKGKRISLKRPESWHTGRNWNGASVRTNYKTYVFSKKEWIFCLLQSIGITGVVNLFCYRSWWAWGLVIPVGIWYTRWKQKEMAERRRRILQNHFKDVLQSLQTAVRAGYSMEQSVTECRREMERGLGEKEAYEQLGERWGLLSYRTLSSILVQCLQKGSNGVEQVLAKEAEQAQRLRRQQAQILGEQASTRLLFPMILMLLVVFVILLVPAWLMFAV